MSFLPSLYQRVQDHGLPPWSRKKGKGDLELRESVNSPREILSYTSAFYVHLFIAGKRFLFAKKNQVLHQACLPVSAVSVGKYL